MECTIIPSLEPKMLHPMQPTSLQPSPGKSLFSLKPVLTDRDVFVLKCVDINAKQLGKYLKGSITQSKAHNIPVIDPKKWRSSSYLIKNSKKIY